MNLLFISVLGLFISLSANAKQQTNSLQGNTLYLFGSEAKELFEFLPISSQPYGQIPEGKNVIFELNEIGCEGTGEAIIPCVGGGQEGFGTSGGKEIAVTVRELRSLNYSSQTPLTCESVPSRQTYTCRIQGVQIGTHVFANGAEFINDKLGLSLDGLTYRASSGLFGISCSYESAFGVRHFQCLTKFNP